MNSILVQTDKTVVKVTGLDIRGLRPVELEDRLKEKTGGIVRVIGVTGQSLEMDVYGLSEEDILRDGNGFISALSLCEGITVSDITEMESCKRIRPVDFERLPAYTMDACPGQKWIEK